jgi:hypothetical protein
MHFIVIRFCTLPLANSAGWIRFYYYHYHKHQCWHGRQRTSASFNIYVQKYTYISGFSIVITYTMKLCRTK